MDEVANTVELVKYVLTNKKYCTTENGNWYKQ